MAEIGNEVPSANAARLPALGAPELSVEYLAKIKEIIEVVLGRRGSPWDRAVTFRDMNAGGLGGFIPGMAGATAALFNPATGQVTTEGGATFDIDAALRESAAYKDLLARIGSTEELADLPAQISRQLEEALIDVARARGNDIRAVENKLHNEQVSLAWRLEELTASLNQTAAGVRTYNAAFADDVRAVATRVEQVAAELAAGGGGVEVQEQITAISDAVEGLQGQWSLKIQTNPTNGQPPIIAGIALSVEDPIAGPGTSSLVFLADQVGFYTAGGTLNPFSISGNQVKMANVIAESLKVVMADGTVVLDAGKTLAQQTSSNPNLVPNCMGWPYLDNGASKNRNGDGRFGDGQYFYLPTSPDARFVGVQSPELGIPWGSYHTVSFDAYCEGASRYLNVDIVNDIDWDSAGVGVWLTNTVKRYSFTEAAIGNANAPKGRLRMFTTAAGGSPIVIANIKVELGATVTPWCDSVVTGANAKNRVFIPNLAALSAFFGDVQLGIGGALWAGQTAYDTGNGLRLGTDGAGNPYLSMRAANGKYWKANLATGELETNGLKSLNPEYAPFSVSIGSSIVASGVTNTLSMGSRTATIVGAYESVLWSVEEEDYAGRITISGASTPTASFTSIVPSRPNENYGRVTCTVIGTDKRIARHTVDIIANHN